LFARLCLTSTAPQYLAAHCILVSAWLDAPERVNYKLSLFARRCLTSTAPQYLAAHCILVSATDASQHLRSAASHQLVVPSYRLSSSYGRRAFSVAGPMTGT